MVIIIECDESGNIIVPQTAEERKTLKKQCIYSCKGHMSRDEFNQIIHKVYGDLYEYFSDTDSEYGSSDSVETLTKMRGCFIDAEVLRYTSSSVDYDDIEKLCSKRSISSTKNEKDMILDLCEEGEVVCLLCPRGSMMSLLDNFWIQLPFIDFRSNYSPP